MTEIVKGLFGFSPQELAQQRDQELTTKANAFAQLSPEQRATQMLYRGGNQLAGAVGGMLGAQDPQMKKSSDLQSIMQSGDFNTVEGATSMAQQAAAMGYGNEAQQMYAHAQGLRKSAADLGLTEARTQQALREKQGADPLQQLIRTGKYTPASVQKYSETGNVADLDNVEKADQTALSETSEGIYLVNKTTGEKIARIGSAPQRGVNVKTVLPPTESQFQKDRGGLQAKKLDAAEEAAKVSSEALGNLAVMKTAMKDGKIMSGPLAGTAMSVTQILSSIGAVSKETADLLAKTEIYDKNAKDLVLKDLGGKLGGQISDADREFIEARIPQLKNSQQAREELIARLELIHKRNIVRGSAMAEYADKNGSLVGYKDPAPGASLSPADKAAKEWATKNPNDPRASRILQRLGGI